MLDAYTSTMCQKSWGRNSYAQALMEVSSLASLKESLVVAIPFPNGMRHYLETVEVGYEWQPPGVSHVKRKNGKGKQDGKAKKKRLWIWITPPHMKTSCLNVAAKVSLEDVLDDDDEDVEEVYIKDNGRHAKQIKGQALLLIRFKMFSIALWNIRGMNQTPKQKE
nr:zinc knuckle CX2CX4HX4C [Tanacetum cinerariifolium]